MIGLKWSYGVSESVWIIEQSNEKKTSQKKLQINAGTWTHKDS